MDGKLAQVPFETKSKSLGTGCDQNLSLDTMYIMEVKFRTSDTICDKNSSYKFCGQSCSLTIKKNKKVFW